MMQSGLRALSVQSNKLTTEIDVCSVFIETINKSTDCCLNEAKNIFTDLLKLVWIMVFQELNSFGLM